MFARGKSMLTQAEMLVVFVLDETISQGSEESLTAGFRPTSLMDMVHDPLKCHRDELDWKQSRWNAVNPSSEKPKIR